MGRIQTGEEELPYLNAWATEKLYLCDMADWERSKRGKVYPAGSTLLQVSATKGQLIYLEEDQQVKPSMYVVIEPKKGMDGAYLYMALTHYMPAFLSRIQTGLNIHPDDLYEMKLTVHLHPQTQHASGQAFLLMNREEEQAKKEMEFLQELKRYDLQKMFPR